MIVKGREDSNMNAIEASDICITGGAVSVAALNCSYATPCGTTIQLVSLA